MTECAVSPSRSFQNPYLPRRAPPASTPSSPSPPAGAAGTGLREARRDHHDRLLGVDGRPTSSPTPARPTAAPSTRCATASPSRSSPAPTGAQGVPAAAGPAPSPTPPPAPRPQQAIRHLKAGGGTAIGTWLQLARALFAAAHPADVRTRSCSPTAATASRPTTLQRRAGRMRRPRSSATAAASAPTGGSTSCARSRRRCSAPPTACGPGRPRGRLPGDDRGRRWARPSPSCALRLWTPAGAAVRFVKQVAPTVEDLTGRRTDAAPAR